MNRFFIGNNGSACRDGSAEHPFSSLQEAQEGIRKQRNRTEPCEVIIQPGQYPVTEPLILDERDSGTESAPVIWKAEKAGTVRLDCGVKLSGRELVTDPCILKRLRPEARGKIWQCDLRQSGVNDPGELRERGFTFTLHHDIPAVEFYCGGTRMTLSRYPKNGFLEPKSLVQPGVVGGETSILEYDSPCHERWKDTEDLWIFGYFRYRWADAQLKAAKAATATPHLTMDHAYTCSNNGTMDMGQGILYCAMNLLEELSQPGEWYLDRGNMILYFYPPAGVDPQTAKLELTLLNEMPVNMKDVQYVTLEGLHFDLGRYYAIGMNNCSHCVINACTITRFAASGIVAENVTNCLIRNCELSWLGRQGIEISGGNRETLTPSYNVIENNRIHDFGLLDHTYTPAVWATGTAIRISHNLFYNSPSSVFRLEGNDIIFEYNEVHHAVRESDDQGAVDIYGNPSYRGNIFRYNYFHDVGRPPSDKGFFCCGVAGIRLDDVISGTVLYGNIFERCSCGHFGAVQMNCGRDNIIENNLFLDCMSAVSGGFNGKHFRYAEVAEGKPILGGCYLTELYFARYPALKFLFDENGKNFFRHNIISGCGTLKVKCQLDDPGPGLVVQDNVFIRKNGQNIPEAMNEGKGIGFQRIPFEMIGLCKDDTAAWNNCEEAYDPGIPLPSWERNPAPDSFRIEGKGEILPDWRIFGPFSQEFTTEQYLTDKQEKIEFQGVKYLPHDVPVEDGITDPAIFSEGKKEHEVYWIYTTVVSYQDGPLTLGAGFDFWGKIWLDGKMVFDTGKAGNAFEYAHAEDQIFTVQTTAGEHVLAIRLESGSDARATLALKCGNALLRSVYKRWWWLEPSCSAD